MLWPLNQWDIPLAKCLVRMPFNLGVLGSKYFSSRSLLRYKVYFFNASSSYFKALNLEKLKFIAFHMVYLHYYPISYHYMVIK